MIYERSSDWLPTELRKISLTRLRYGYETYWLAEPLDDIRRGSLSGKTQPISIIHGNLEKQVICRSWRAFCCDFSIVQHSTLTKELP